MKIILVIASLVALAFAGPSIKDEWTSFKIQHGKTYRTESEELKRHAIFMENLKMIEEHNAKYEAGLVSYHMKVNTFSDLLPEEVSALLNGYKKSEKQGSLRTVFQPEDNAYVPESIDWRQKGAVTAVKNQGRCGGCWAFSTTGAMEGQLFKKTGKLVSLSEQQLIDCSRAYGNEGCNGGLMDNAFKYLMSSGGLASESSYPFEGRNEYCGYSSEAVSGTSVKNFVDVAQEDEDALKKAVGTVGPVSIAVSAGNSGFLQYGGGIFSGDTCESSQLDHGILVVGYGSEDGQDYWIVKNSWGSTWGEEGYMRLARNNDNACGIASDASYPQL